jgi:hypothetical protein
MGWNMKNLWRGLLLTVLGCFLLSCGSLNKNNSEAAVRRAIEAHLAGRTGLASDKIVMDIQKVQFQGDRAEVDVVFHSRTDPKASMTFHYQLRNDGKEWKVDTGRPSSEASPHPSSEMPSGSAPPLPEGHPPTQP